MELIISRLVELYNIILTHLDSLGIDLSRLADLLVYDSRQPLLFNTGLFLILFTLFVIVYRALRPWRVARMIFVILFSIYFYYKASGECCLILLGVAVSDYVLGMCMHGARSLTWGRTAVMKLIVVLNVTVNVGLLAYFKYFGLLIDTLNSFFTTRIDPINVILPAGISFFTFRSISYIVDIYRGHTDACRNPLDYLFFLTFFPPLLAGPVVRAKDMLPQIKANPVATHEMTSEGIYLIILGIIKKMVIADFISGNFVDRVFDNPALYSGFENMMATFGFTIQLYCDFSGYSDIAIGIALLLGYRFKENFNSPFKAANPTEFWHRWHISLSSWLRDYLYISLGGNRKGRVRTYINLLLTMVLGGLWHGAAVRFVLWGALHGLALALHKMWMAIIPWAKADGKDMNIVSRLVGFLVTFNLVCLGWLLFRADSMQTVHVMLYQIFHNFDASLIPQVVAGYKAVFALIAAGYVMHFMPAKIDADLQNRVVNASFWWQVAMLTLTVWCVMQIKSSDIQPFIYFQF